jgi:hypothetical protein
MITWATTVAPETLYSSTGSSASTQNANPGAAASITVSITEANTYWQNWSRSSWSETYARAGDPGGGNASSDSTVSVLGLVNSSAAKTRIAQNGNTVSYERSYTLRSVLNATSATTTRSYTYRATALSASTYSIPTTSSSGSVTFTRSTSVNGNNVTTLSTATAQETRYTTVTTPIETVRTPILATIVQADKDEVIWAANSSAATQRLDFVAASNFATTATRTTVLPWTQTEGVLQKHSSQSSQIVTAQLSQSITFAVQGFAQATLTSISNYNALPHQTRTFAGQTPSTTASQSNLTIANAASATANNSVAENVFYTSSVHLPVTRNQMAFNSTTTQTGTRFVNATRPYAETFSSSRTFEIPAVSLETITVSTLVGGTVTTTTGTSYTWTGTATTSRANFLTTFAIVPQGASVFTPGAVSISRDCLQGVYDNGQIADGYSCPELGIVSDALAQISRSVSSMFPKSTTIESGSLTISSLSGTLNNTDNETQSFVFTPFGTGRLLLNQAGPNSSDFNAAHIGAAESFYQTLSAGVYTSNGGSFSTSGGCQSWAAGAGSRPPLFAVSHIGPSAARNGASPIWWTVSRNSHAAHGVITAANNYSAT